RKRDKRLNGSAPPVVRRRAMLGAARCALQIVFLISILSCSAGGQLWDIGVFSFPQLGAEDPILKKGGAECENGGDCNNNGCPSCARCMTYKRGLVGGLSLV